MALNVTLASGGHGGKQPSAPLMPVVVDVDFDSSYPTGGETFDAAAEAKRLGKLDKTPDLVAVVPLARAGHVFEYDYANKKLLAYWGDNNNANDGPLVEVPNTQDLSAVTDVKVMIWIQ